MTFAKVRLLAAGILFFAWIAVLGYMAFTTGKPVVISRPQILVSSLIVVAQVNSFDGPVKVVDAPGDPQEADKLTGNEIVVTNLAAAEVRGAERVPGLYILPLQRTGDTYQVAPTPPSPGFHSGPAGSPRIYPANSQTLAQLATIPRP
jgi:hypothetical protein